MTKTPPPLRSRRHIVIPDVQVRPKVNTDHLEHIGRYIAEKRFDVIVCLGDFADMESLSSYDRGKKSFEGRRYRADIEASLEAMIRLTDPFMTKGYSPKMVMCLGNHEDRITRAVEEDARLEGTMGLIDLQYETFGWEVYPFLKIVNIDGVSYCHYVTTGALGRPATSAKRCMDEVQGSVVVGHSQEPGDERDRRAAPDVRDHGRDGLHAQGELLGPAGEQPAATGARTQRSQQWPRRSHVRQLGVLKEEIWTMKDFFELFELSWFSHRPPELSIDECPYDELATQWAMIPGPSMPLTPPAQALLLEGYRRCEWLAASPLDYNIMAHEVAMSLACGEYD